MDRSYGHLRFEVFTAEDYIILRREKKKWVVVRDTTGGGEQNI
jgi:hypothetical protein